MTKEEIHNLYKDAIHKWGNDSQMNMVVEECAELIQAVNKFKRDPSAERLKELCSEIADVEIMCEQARIILNKSGLVDLIKEEKIGRLKSRLEQSKIRMK